MKQEITFKALNLHPTILGLISKKGYTTPTKVQAKSIPHLLKGSDLLGISQTGTGKTASFSLPIINNLIKNPVDLEANHTRAIVLAPTRELATQIYKNIVSYSDGLELTSAVIIGGVRKENQIEEMKNGVDIIVATPGRLLDLLGGGYILFDQLEVFVLDEGDMMLNMGFYEDVKTIETRLPKVRQTMLFSATMPKEIETLAKSLLVKPIKIMAAPESSTIDKINQQVYFVDEEDKLALLGSLLEDDAIERVLVFCKAKYGIANVVEHLNASGITNGEIHSNRTQIQRDQAMQDFRDGKVRVLVATDIASRGLDVKGVTHVINFNLPDDRTYYVHRVGRTARAGKEGTAISLCGERDLALLRNVQKIIKIQIPTVIDQPYHKVFAPLNPKKRQNSTSAQNRARKRPSQAKRNSKKKFIENL